MIGKRSIGPSQLVVLYLLGVGATASIFTIDLYAPKCIAVGVAYTVIVFYSWILPGKNTPGITALLCSVLVVLAFGLNHSESDRLEGGNIALSFFSIWVCTGLVYAAKRSVEGLELAQAQLETKVEKRTNQLSRSRKMFKSILENAPDSMVIVDREGVIKVLNTAAEDLFGVYREVAKGESIGQFLPQELHEEFTKLVGYNGHDGEVIGSEKLIKAKTKDGREFDAELRMSPIETEEGRLVNIVVRDFSEKVAAEKKIKEINDKLVEKNREMEQFVYVASHDLKEPLRTLSSYSDLLMTNYGDQLDGLGKKSLEFMQRANVRMESLITGLLEYGLIGQNPELKEIDCSKLINELKIDLEGIITRTKTELTVGEMPTIKGYAVELRLLFQNLITNSMKFQNPGVNPEIHVSSKKVGSGWEFCVKDNGIGIAPENQEKIFSIFQRIHNRSDYEGTGIGLAHCVKVVKLHRGKMWVESTLGEGSSFYFFIPNLT